MHSWRSMVPRLLLTVAALALTAAAAAPAVLGQTPPPGGTGPTNPPPLFGDAGARDPAPTAASAQEQKATIRQRSVSINLSALDAAQGEVKGVPPGTSRDRVSLNLFSDVTLVAVRDRMERRPSGGFTWVGHVEGVPFSSVTLVVADGVVVGNVTMPSGHYELRYTAGGTHVVRQVNPGAYPDEGPTKQVPLEDLLQAPAPPTPQRDDGSMVDVLVVYATASRIAAGGTSAMNALIDLMVTETNTAYANSGVNHRVQVVHSAEESYTGTGNLDTDLSRLTNASDGFMDDVLPMRNTFGADVVTLLVEDGGPNCGLSWLMSPVAASFESFAYNVVVRSCATGNYSFGHEVGHNMGARHDWLDDTTDNSPFTYNHGYVAPGNAWRTIMATVASCNGCPRLQYFSNPNVLYQGGPMGVAEGQFHAADNHKTFNNTALTVSNFRQTVGGPPPPGSPTPTSTTGTGGPANDNFANAQVVGVPSMTNGSNLGATVEALEATPSCGGIGASVWFRFTPSFSGPVTASTAGGNFDTTLALYSGASLNGLTELACNDDISPPNVVTSQLTANVTAGTTYTLRLAGFNAAMGSYTLTLSSPAAGTPTATATPPAGSGLGGHGFGISPGSGGTTMTWQTGIGQLGYLILQMLPIGNIASPAQPANATQFFDGRSFSGPACFVLVPFGNGGALGRSDFLCWLANTRSATGAPQNFTMRLNESNTASFTWTGPLGGGQTGYLLVPLGGQPISLPGTATSATAPAMPGTFTCYILFALQGQIGSGSTDVLCGFPGLSQL